jgi:(1->4)-alpha-D-glucan 1-alpha-D-glucosylmutase
MRPVTATYRLQLHRDFAFAEALRRVPYLAALGISHLYLSPITQARAGSRHGYDVVDPTRISPELGGERGFRDLADAAGRAGLGIIVDIVPNHMATDAANPAWMDVLENGREAASAKLFDIDWSAERLVLPVLGGSLDEALARGEIAIETDAATGKRVARYFEQRFPLRPDIVEGDAPLADLLAAQHWRLADWREASRALTYRRFFNITELIGVRIEDPAVFEHVHRLPLSLLREGLIDGLRIDHVDGLADPEAYCRRLRAEAGPEALIVVEKILEGDEALRGWGIDGTTGYDRLNDINALFIDAEGYQALDRRLVERGLLAGAAMTRLASAKRQVLEDLFGSEVARLARLAAPILPDASPVLVRAAVMALLIHFPVYRSYASERGHEPQDETLWAAVEADVGRHEPPEVAAAVARLTDALSEDREPAFATGLQQLAGPAMAKGLEDTEFYRSVALLSANEVGADPAHPSISIERFHARNRAALRRRDLVPLATHDTKRGPDVRARLNLLSEDAEGAIALLDELAELAEPLRDDPVRPDGLDLWLILQTVLGAWPLTAERLEAYSEKAMREAKRRTRWEAPEESYEAPTRSLCRAIADGETGAGLREAVEDALADLDPFARTESVAQLVLQLTVPGIPDTYQGTEFWDHSLVDPDNRRPVDFSAREEALSGGVWVPFEQDAIGLTKVRTLRRLLALRRSHPSLFAESGYEPVAVEGGPARFLGFRRPSPAGTLLVAVPTRPTRLEARSIVTGLPEGRWRNAMSGREFVIGSGGLALDRSWPFVIAHDIEA